MHAGLSQQEDAALRRLLAEGHLRILYIAPERLRSQAVCQLLQDGPTQGNLAGLAVDEAHCISTWCHDFRPQNRHLGELRQVCPGVPVLALSATAAPRVQAGIIRLLALRRPLVQVSSARRPNLR